jgi:hypothetical protein
MRDDEVGLAEAIDVLRRELSAAQQSAQSSDLRFTLGPIEVEFAVDVARKAGGDVTVKVLGILSGGIKGEETTTDKNRVKIVLNPVDVNGEPFEVAAQRAGRPDER